MSTWAIYSILAGAAYGLSAVPIRYVSSRSHLSAPSELIFMFSSIWCIAWGRHIPYIYRESGTGVTYSRKYESRYYCSWRRND